jgi:hypothetical protein
MQIIKNIRAFARALVPQFVVNMAIKWNQRRILKRMQKIGSTAPASHATKQKVIAEYQRRSGYTTLVETGTYLGDMVEAQKTNFEKIISIELSADLFHKANERFKDDQHVVIVHGDSGKLLAEILQGIVEPAIFWLDGHYSGGMTAKGDKACPVFEELEAILGIPNLDHIILIDDARCFIGMGDYPTLHALTKFVKEKNPECQVEIKDDIIRYVIRNGGTP